MSGKKDGRKFKLSDILGEYTPPPFIRNLGASIKGFFAGKLAPLAKKAFAFVVHNRKLRIIAGSAALAVAAIAIGVSLWRTFQPKLMKIDYAIASPSPRIDPDQPISSLVVSFYGSAAKTEDAGKAVTAGITMKPAVAGSWRWEEDNRLVFTPVSDWPIGTEYSVEFARDFFPDHVRIDRKFSFATQRFDASITAYEFYIDPENSRIKRVLATISANYPIDPESLEGNVSLRPKMLASSGSFQDKAYQYSVGYSDDRLRAYIVSEPLGMPVNDVLMELVVQNGVRSSLGGPGIDRDLKSSVTIPGASDYIRVNGLLHDLVKTPDQKYDQVIILETNGEIDTKELQKNLSAYLLPVDRPEMPGIEAAKDYQWENPDEMTEQILKLSEPVKLIPIPNARNVSAVNSFRIEAVAGRYLYVKLNGGTRFYGDYFLKNDYQALFRVREYPKEVSIVSDGSILSLTGSKQLAMLSRGIGEVQFEVGRIRPDDINHLVSQSNGDLSSFRFTNYNFNEYNVTAQFAEEQTVPIGSARDVSYFSFDFSRYLESIPSQNLRYGLFIFKVKGKDKNRNFSDKRLIMVTDLGFFVKTNTNKTKDIFVQSIATGNPVGGATVTVLGLNGNPIASGETNGSGHVQFPDLSGYLNEKRPMVIVVRQGEDLSFMPYRAEGRYLDYSSFDTGGVVGATDPKTINAFIFSDRGIYRPGDEIRMGMIVKAGDWKINLAKTPLECKIVDSKGSEVYARRISLSSEGFEEIKYRTEDYSPTGVYTVSLYFIREDHNDERVFLGSETVKVEEFLPDNLNITAAFSPIPKTGWIQPGKLDGIVTLKNLFGTVAAGNDVKAQITLLPGTQYFRQYRDYTFSDPYSSDKSYKEFLGTKQTDKDGKVTFPIDLLKFEKATYSLRFYAEGFEKGGGRNVSYEASVFVSPLQYLVGYKADGDLKYVNKDSKRAISLIAIDPDLARTNVGDLELTINELRYISVLLRQPNGVYKYQSVEKSFPVTNKTLKISAAGTQYFLPTGTEGDFEVILTGKDGLVYNKFSYSVIGEKNIERSLNRTAELNVRLDRQDFKNGETAQVFIKAPYAGAGLITIERDKVYAHKWFQSDGLSTVQSIDVPADLEGNGYVTVTYVRSLSSREIYMSPLSYASVPFSVSKDSKTNKITLDFPSEAKPGKDFVINYSSSKKGKIVITAVDEGILQVAQYQTPNPIAFFFKKRALEVSTAQILDLVLPEFSVVRSLAAMGGDGGMEELNRNLNPFKRKRNVPVAYWSGVIDTGPESRSVSYAIPDYFNGSIRVMAVAVSDDAIGATADKAIIRNTFVITPNVPMMASPSDEFEVSVTVTNNQKGVGKDGKVSLSVKPSPHLAVLSQSSMVLDIPEGQDKTVTYKVKANNVVGGAELRFIASNGAEVSELASYLSVRPAVPYRVTLSSGTLRKNRVEIPINRSVYEEFATRDVSLSYLPLSIAKGLFFYLEKYPYGCSEQLVSAAYPLLYPKLFKELGMTQTQADDGVNRIISILQARMRGDNTIGLWTSLSDSDPYLMAYCVHFLTDARAKGYYVPPAFMEKCLRGLKEIAEGSGSSHYNLIARSYAIYVLTRNEVITTQYITSLKRDMKKYDEGDVGYPSLFLAGSYAMLKQDFEASTLLGKIKREFRKDSSYRYVDGLCFTSLYLDMVARHFPQRLKDVTTEQLLAIAQEMEQQRYSTLSANYALMAIESYLAAVPTAETGRFTITEVDANKKVSELAPKGDPIFSAAFTPAAKRLALQNKDDFSLFYQVTLAGFDLELPKTETKEGIEVYREFTDASGNKVTSVSIGDEVYVKLNFRSIASEYVSDVAIVDMLPAGLEADIDSIRNPSDSSRWRPDYVDIREDRIVVFGSVSQKLNSFVYKARAINKGTFTVPPLFAEAMYDKKTWAFRPQAPLTVKDK